MILRASAVVAALGGMLLGTSVWAVPIAVTNHSFEAPDVSSGGNTWSDVNLNWGDDAGASGDEFTEMIAGFAADGLQHTGVQAMSSLMQDLGDTYAARTRYTLSVGVGNRANFTSAGNQTIVRLADATDGSILAESIFDASLIPVGAFEDRSLSYITGAAGGSIGNAIRIELAVGDAAFGRAHFDNVRLDATVIPEPGAIVLLGLGLLGVAARTWRRRS